MPKTKSMELPINPIDAGLQKILLIRATRYLEGAIKNLPRDVVQHAIAAPNDDIATFEVVVRPETISKAVTEDPLAEARARGRKSAELLLRMEGGCGTVKDAMFALDISKPAVEKRRKKGNLITIDTGKKGILYPHWQFKRKGYGVLDGLEEILQTLTKHGCLGWSVFSFFLNPHIDLDGLSPLKALRQGKTEEVLVAASNYGEMGS